MYKEQRVKLTGKYVSDDFLNIVNRLESGEYVSLEEINKTSEIRLARTNINYSIPTADISERDDMDMHIAEEILSRGSANGVDNDGETVYNGGVSRASRLDIVVGLPASGKSSAVVDKISQFNNSRVIDNDEVKKMLPQYNNGWGAGIVHKESKKIENRIFKIAIQNGDNIVLPKVGSDFDSLMENYIYPAREFGYKVYVHYVELNRNKALGRMLSRFAETGRFLEPGLIDKYAPNGRNRIDETYEKLKKEGGLDGYSKWNNDVRRNEEPRLIENGGKSAVGFYGFRDGRDGDEVGISDKEGERVRETSPGNKKDGFSGAVSSVGRSDGQGGIGYGMGEPGGSILEGSSGLLEGQRGRTYADGGAGEIQESKGMAENTSQQKEDERREISVPKLIEQAEGLGLLSDEELCCVKEILEKHEGFPIDGSVIVGIYREKDEDLFLKFDYNCLTQGTWGTADKVCRDILIILQTQNYMHSKVSYNYVDSVDRILNPEKTKLQTPAYDVYMRCRHGSVKPDCLNRVMYSDGKVKTLESNLQNSIKRTR